MKFLLYIIIFLTFFAYLYANDWNSFARRYFDRSYGKFGLPKQHLYQLGPIYHPQQPSRENQLCLPTIWTCGPDLPPCCPGLICYNGNAKRGRYCIARR